MEVPFVKKNRNNSGDAGEAGAESGGDRKAANDKKKRRLSNGFSLVATPVKSEVKTAAAPVAAAAADESENLKTPARGGLSVNDDEREKAKRRKSLAASHAKRKSMLLTADGKRGGPLSARDMNEKVGDAKAAAAAAGAVKKQLTNQGLSDLYTQCIKLATSNKVTVKNAFQLDLIDYIPDVLSMTDGPDIEIGVSNGDGDGAGGDDGPAAEAVVVKRAARGDDVLSTNFQRASCTLDASVKIYSYRVDAVHKDTFKVLGGLNNVEVGGGDGDEDGEDGDDGDDAAGADGDGKQKPKEKKEKAAKKAGLSTLVSSIDSINVKKFETECEVDPLFHKTSTSFDEGGAKGLLMNNLSVYNGCEIVFDSANVIIDSEETDADGVEGSGSTPEKKKKNKKKRAAADAENSANVQIDMADLNRELLKRWGSAGALKDVLALSLCPTLNELNTLLEEPIDRPAGAPAAVEASKQNNESNQSDGKSSIPVAGSNAAGVDVNGSFGGGDDDGGAMDDQELAEAAEHEDRLFADIRDSAMDDAMPSVVLGFDDHGLEQMQLAKQQAAASAAATQQAPITVRALQASVAASVAATAAASDPASGNGGGAVMSALVVGTEQANEFSYLDQKMLSNWAGPMSSHWKFKATKAAPAAESGGSKRSGSKKEKFVLNFSFGVANPAVPESAFLPPPRSNATLSKAALAKAAADPNRYTLPADTHYSVRTLQTLFNKPHLMVRIGNSREATTSTVAGDVASLVWNGAPEFALTAGGVADPSTQVAAVFVPAPAAGVASSADPEQLVTSTAGAAVEHVAADLSMSGGDDGADGDEHDAGGDSASNGAGAIFMNALSNLGEQKAVDPNADAQPLQLIAEPTKVEKIDINYARFAKKVDVRALQLSIWKQLNDKARANRDESKFPAFLADQKQAAAAAAAAKSGDAEPVQAPKSFQQTIAGLDMWLPKEALSSVSVPFCFICLLHLANEKDLLLQPTGGVLSIAPSKYVPPTDDDASATDAAAAADQIVDELDADGRPIAASSSCSPGLGDFTIIQNVANSAHAQAQSIGAALKQAAKKS